jgi:hypothetical protein
MWRVFLKSRNPCAARGARASKHEPSKAKHESKHARGAKLPVRLTTSTRQARHRQQGPPSTAQQGVYTSTPYGTVYTRNRQARQPYCRA